MESRQANPVVTGMTVAALLRQRALLSGAAIAFSFLDANQRLTQQLTWKALDAQASALAHRLEAKVQPGNRVVLLYQPGLEFVVGFFACLYAKAIAVPAYSLRPARFHSLLLRLRHMINDCEPALILTDNETIRLVAESHRCAEAWYRSSSFLVTSSILPDSGISPDPGQIEVTGHANTPIAIQYTSGSISEPKGVILSSRNVLHNSQSLKEAHQFDETSTVVSWVPLAHDWGLINGVVQPLYSSCHGVIISPESFLQAPSVWLKTISAYPNVGSGGPSFAYDLCVERIEDDDCANLDLSTWRCAGVSAGPVHCESMQRFADRFEAFGFNRDAFYSGYGLAEATLLVCDSERGTFPRLMRVDKSTLEERHDIIDPSVGQTISSFVSCGRPSAHCSVAIVDPDRLSRCPERRVGEIWLAGDNIAAGYWNRPAETCDAFGAVLPDEPSRHFLRTGDLGFMDKGELFVTGRLKDLIICRGRNIYPQDLELTAQKSHKTLRKGCAVAFSIDGDVDDQIVLVQELKSAVPHDVAEATRAIRQQVMLEHGVKLHDIVLVAPGSIPKTSSGKLRRLACRAAYCNGTVTGLSVSGVSPDPLPTRSA